ELTLAAPAKLAFIVETADGYDVDETLTITPGAGQTALAGEHGARIRLVRADAGRVILDYSAVVTGLAQPQPTDEVDMLRY
ncbi:hypothetical protein ACC691_40790, partial [Rhizobium johnstonii]|uniref:hypothetical protein n=1 Tax=Rhizobium johnstonii TaxID=3019933 RepID=UPI003F9A67A2